MSRATIGLTFIAGMVIGLIMISMLLGFCNKAWAWINRGMEGSVDKLAAAIEDVSKEPGKLLNRFITLEERGAIALFAPGAEKLEGMYRIQHAADKYFRLDRPTDCLPTTAACLCACRVKQDMKLAHAACELPHCTTYDSLDVYANYRECKDEQNECFKFVIGGALLYNQIPSEALPGGGRRLGPNRPRQPVTIENYEGMVALCATQPCVTDDDKKLVRQIRALNQLGRTLERCGHAAPRESPGCGCGTFEISKELPDGWQVKFKQVDDQKALALLYDDRRERLHGGERDHPNNLHENLAHQEYEFALCTSRLRDGDRDNRGDLELSWERISPDGGEGSLGFSAPGGARRLGLVSIEGRTCFADADGFDSESLTLKGDGEILDAEGTQVLPACAYT